MNHPARPPGLLSAPLSYICAYSTVSRDPEPSLGAYLRSPKALLQCIEMFNECLWHLVIFIHCLHYLPVWFSHFQ